MLNAIIRKAGRDKKQFRAILKGKNGEIVFSSEMYTRKEKALQAIKLLKDINPAVKDLT
jgi:uncharacterized protein YegP (UPF0339 family)